MGFTVDITITNPDGQKATISGAFDFVTPEPPPPPAPRIDSVSPSSGPSTGGTSVEIRGANFTAGAQVMFGDRLGIDPDVSPDGTSIIVTTPPLP